LKLICGDMLDFVPTPDVGAFDECCSDNICTGILRNVTMSWFQVHVEEQNGRYLKTLMWKRVQGMPGRCELSIFYE